MMDQLPATATVCKEFQLLIEASEFIREAFDEGCEEICRLHLAGKESGEELLQLQAHYARTYALLQKHVSCCPFCQPLARVA